MLADLSATIVVAKVVDVPKRSFIGDATIIKRRKPFVELSDSGFERLPTALTARFGADLMNDNRTMGDLVEIVDIACQIVTCTITVQHQSARVGRDSAN